MMAGIKVFAGLCLLVTVVAAQKVHYYGDKVFRIQPSTEKELLFIHTWIESTGDKIDVWKDSGRVGGDIDVHIRAVDIDKVTEMLNKSNIKYKCLIEDLEKLINEEKKTNHNFAFNGVFNYFVFNRYSSIVEELKRLANSYKNAQIFNVGRSFEGREIVGIKVTDGSGARKPAVWIDGGIHSREWIAPATVLYTLKQLLSPEPTFAANVKSALSKYDFYVLPVFNVDGYEHTHTSDRMWRKTKSIGSNGCYGADPNRNWDSQFGGAGTSSNPCTDIYHGRHAFSEIEVKQVANYLTNIHQSQGLKSYWNVHAYGQFLLYPWSYTRSPAIHDSEIKRVGNVFASGVRAMTGRLFRVGQPSNILYAVAGGSIDWTYEKLGVKYSYAPELRPDQNSAANGFLISTTEIRSSGMEFTNGFLLACLAMN